MIKIFKLISGEMIITEVNSPMEVEALLINYPATCLPGENGKMVFLKTLPVSEQMGITLNSKSVSIDSEPTPIMKKAYEKWVEQARANDAGIITP